MEQNGQKDQNERPKDDNKLPQLPPVLLQKIASMLSDGSEHLQLRDRIRFSSISHQMKTVARSSIDGMDRRRMQISVWETDVGINDIAINHQRSGHIDIDALLAFARPNEFDIFCHGDHMLVGARILASIPPNSVLRLYLNVMVREFGVGTPFYGMLTSVGEMINLEKFTIYCYYYFDRASEAVYRNSSPSLPPGSPFLQLLRLEKLRVFSVYECGCLLTAAQKAALISLSSSHISHICFLFSHFGQLVASLNDRSCSDVTSVCCLDGDCLLRSSDQFQLLVERLPQCSSVSALVDGDIPDQRTIDQMAGRLLESVITVGRKKMTVRLRIHPSGFRTYLSAGGQTVFTYEHKSTVIQVLIVSRLSYSHDQ